MAAPSLLCEVGANGLQAPYVTVFTCANCARPSTTPELANRARPGLPTFDWPFPAQDVLLACAGRLQPEHVLKAFESGARLVCVVACGEDNCHHLEGSMRCARRVDYVRGLLDEIGLGADRLMLFHLPGTAAQDMALTAGRRVTAPEPGAVEAAVTAIRAEVLQALEILTPTPLDLQATEAVQDPYQQVDTSDDNNEE
jgi:F420-non-reducing hydrogenase iron-sulfur subunit